jgi:hypothetical protein
MALLLMICISSMGYVTLQSDTHRCVSLSGRHRLRRAARPDGCGDNFCNPQILYYLYEALANRRSNAGLGWLLTLGGRLHGPDDDVGGYPTGSGWIYEGPDGAEHVFYALPHQGSFNVFSQSAYYTNDNSFLRLRMVSLTHAEIDFPDGATNEFDTDSNGIWQLSRRRDQYKDSGGNYRNWVTVTYAASSPACDVAAPGENSVWIIQDALGRRHDVCFAQMYYEDHYIEAPTAVVLSGFEGQRVNYTFAYLQQNVYRSCFETYRDALAPVSECAYTYERYPSQ